jgi:Flp pilus assembly protein TadG
MKHPRPKIRADVAGSVAIQVAILITVLIGFAALGSEVGYLYFQQRQMQAASDSAAFGGAVALSTGHPANFKTESAAVAAKAGYTNGVASTTVVVNNPPASGNYTANAKAVEVIITRQFTMGLMTLFVPSPITVKARAVAISGVAGGRYCVFALDPSAAGALTLDNNAVIANPVCGVAVNSSSSTALVLDNNAAIDGPVSVHGQWSLSNNAVLSGTPQQQNAPVVSDPYAAVQLLTAPACTGQSGTVSGTATLTAGHFCNGFSFSNNAVVTLGAGSYYIDQQLSFSNNVTVNATSGVTLIVNGNYAINITNNVTLNLTAPATGPYAGLAFLSSRTATSTITQTFNNNDVLKITGAIYFPNQIIDYQNNSATAATQCTQIIGRMVEAGNNVELDNNCIGTGVIGIGSSSSKLAE